MFGGVNPPGTPPFLCTFFFGGQVQAGGERKGGVGVGAAVTSAVSSTAAPRRTRRSRAVSVGSIVPSCLGGSRVFGVGSFF